MPARKASRLSSYAFMLLNTVTWGAALIVVKPAFDVTTPFRFLFYRFLFASILCIPLLIHYLPKIKKPFATITRVSLLELLGTTLVLSLLYLGLDRTTAIEASLLTTTEPIFIAVLGIILLKERVEKREGIGLSLAVIGTLGLALIPVLHGGTQFERISLEGNALIVLQNTLTAFYFIRAKSLYRKLPKLFVATIGFYVGMISFGIISLMEAQSTSGLLQAIYSDFQHLSVWVASGYMALFGSIIGLTAYIKGQDGIEASEAAVFIYLQPLVYIPLGILLLSEQIYPLQLISLAVILFGVVMAEKRRA